MFDIFCFVNYQLPVLKRDTGSFSLKAQVFSSIETLLKEEFSLCILHALKAHSKV